ncbi:MAG: flagellar hook-length control protein FliK [Phycisphaerales bacterium]|jgi:flagellar hook-length control protein FliK
MQQQVQLSPKVPDAERPQRSAKEREVRVQGDAATFGMLLGALQAGEAGIVRGEARNDSAAEWNAQDARENRQQPRQTAQNLGQGAQEPRGRLEQLVSEATRPTNGPQTPAAEVRASTHDPAMAARSQFENQPVPQDPPQPSGDQISRGEQRSTPEHAVVQQRAQAVAASVSTASTAVAAGARAGVQSSQVGTVDAARGPQGGAARGRAPSVPQRADQTLRFEKAFQAQVGRGLAQALRSGNGEVTLRLRPENLGQLSVRVQVQQNQVTATFEARHAEAQRMLEGSRDVLRQQLESRGLTVERIDVRLIEEPTQAGTRLAMDRDGGADGGQDGQAFAGERDGRGSSDGDGADGGSRRGATRDDDGLAVAGAEPWRALGTVRLNAIA